MTDPTQAQAEGEELPELPCPAVCFADHSYPAFSAKQMKDYARLALSRRAPPAAPQARVVVPQDLPMPPYSFQDDPSLRGPTEVVTPYRAPPAAGGGGVRPEVLAFAQLMEMQLRENSHKPGWKNDTPAALSRRLREEVDELDEVTAPGSRTTWDAHVKRVGAEAADVANFAMMIADVCGALDLSRRAPPAADEDIARLFHEAYERRAPDFGYKTREASAKPWDEVPQQNKALMIAVAGEVKAALLRPPAAECGLVEALEQIADASVHEFDWQSETGRTFKNLYCHPEETREIAKAALAAHARQGHAARGESAPAQAGGGVG